MFCIPIEAIYGIVKDTLDDCLAAEQILYNQWMVITDSDDFSVESYHAFSIGLYSVLYERRMKSAAVVLTSFKS